MCSLGSVICILFPHFRLSTFSLLALKITRTFLETDFLLLWHELRDKGNGNFACWSVRLSSLSSSFDLEDGYSAPLSLGDSASSLWAFAKRCQNCSPQKKKRKEKKTSILINIEKQDFAWLIIKLINDIWITCSGNLLHKISFIWHAISCWKHHSIWLV